jgi:putative PIN family toxin of toxin-antitoxin system
VARAVIDTNVLISILLGSRNCLAVRGAFLDGLFEIITSPELITEFNVACRKPKIPRFVNPHDILDTLELLKSDAEWISPVIKVVASRDPKDNPVLECAVAGQADFIVTGDKDLLDLKSFRGIKIITPRQFLVFLKRN